MYLPAEIWGTDKNADVKNPLTAAYLRIEKGPAASPPKYEFDEAGIILEGNNTRLFVWFHDL